MTERPVLECAAIWGPGELYLWFSLRCWGCCCEYVPMSETGRSQAWRVGEAVGVPRKDVSGLDSRSEAEKYDGGDEAGSERAGERASEGRAYSSKSGKGRGAKDDWGK